MSSSRTYSRKTSIAAEVFADDAGDKSSSGKRAKSASSPSAARQLLSDEGEFLLMGGSLDHAALATLIGHPQWSEVATALAPRFASVLASGGPITTVEEVKCILGVAIHASSEHVPALLARCADSVQLTQDACARLLEHPSSRNVGGINCDTATKLVRACKSVEADWIGLLERLSCCCDGRAALRAENEMIDSLARRLEQKREEAVFRVLVNITNESAETSVRY
jgi:hypothetical protein